MSPLSLVHIKLQCSEKNENNTFSKKKKTKNKSGDVGLGTLDEHCFPVPYGQVCEVLAVCIQEVVWPG